MKKYDKFDFKVCHTSYMRMIIENKTVLNFIKGSLRPLMHDMVIWTTKLLQISSTILCLLITLNTKHGERYSNSYCKWTRWSHSDTTSHLR